VEAGAVVEAGDGTDAAAPASAPVLVVALPEDSAERARAATEAGLGPRPPLP
jgi:hypothetical protein